MKQKKGVAFFDLDGTITFKDSFIDFIRYSEGNYLLFLGLLFNFPFIILYFLKCYSNHRLKERVFTFFFKNCTQSELIGKGILYSRQHLLNICYPSALKLIQWHKDQNHDVYILTASSGIWLDEWCKANNLILIGTNFETVNGVYTGRIEGKNCHGEEKEHRIREILSTYNALETYGYGNEKSDRYYLNKMKFKLNAPLNQMNVNMFLKSLIK